MAAPLTHAISSVIGAAKKYFPHSPAKVGPFSGRGYTSYSGVALIEGFMEGIQQTIPKLTQALQSGLAMPQMVLAGDAPAQAVDAGRLVAPTVNVGQPNISVMIGNRVVDDYVTDIVTDNNRRRDRLTATGWRR